MAKTKVFVSYDYDHDAHLKDTLMGQSRLRDSPFSINDMSLKQATPEWQQKARAAIEACELFIVLLGEHTHQAQGVRREVEMEKLEETLVLEVELDGTNAGTQAVALQGK